MGLDHDLVVTTDLDWVTLNFSAQNGPKSCCDEPKSLIDQSNLLK